MPYADPDVRRAANTAWKAKYRQANREKVREYDRAYTPRRVAMRIADGRMERDLAASRERKNAVRSQLRGVVSDLICVDCGASGRLEFHHRDPRAKVNSVTQLLSWPLMITEIEKCDPLCSKCHHRRHRLSRAAARTGR